MACGCSLFSPVAVLGPCLQPQKPSAALDMSRGTRGSYVGGSDQTQSTGGLTLPPCSVVRLFQTMWPVYFGLKGMPLTPEPIQSVR